MYIPLCQTFFFFLGGGLFLNLMVLLLLLYPLAIYQEAKTGPGTVFINHSDVFVLSSLVSTENQGTKKKTHSGGSGYIVFPRLGRCPLTGQSVNIHSLEVKRGSLSNTNLNNRLSILLKTGTVNSCLYYTANFLRVYSLEFLNALSLEVTKK